MPLAKSATVSTVTVPVHIEAESQFTPNGVPVDLYMYFGVDYVQHTSQKDIDQLKRIWSWAKDKDATEGDALMKIRSLERKLGASSLGEKRHQKMYNWVKLSQHVNRLRDEIAEVEKIKTSQERGANNAIIESI